MQCTYKSEQTIKGRRKLVLHCVVQTAKSLSPYRVGKYWVWGALYMGELESVMIRRGCHPVAFLATEVYFPAWLGLYQLLSSRSSRAPPFPGECSAIPEERTSEARDEEKVIRGRKQRRWVCR